MKLLTPSKSTNLVVCVPCRDTIHTLFSHNLIKLVQWCSIANIPVNVVMQTGSLIASQRQKLAEEALRQNASHILWLDSDMSFPVSIVETMMRHNLPVVACNYSTRTKPFKGVAYKKIGEWDSWLGFELKSPRMVKVEGVGMGCMLTSTEVFKDLPRPWFEINWHDEYQDYIGEDFYFCKKLQQHGFDINIDVTLSREIKHLGITSFDLTRTI